MSAIVVTTFPNAHRVYLVPPLGNMSLAIRPLLLLSRHWVIWHLEQCRVFCVSGEFGAAVDAALVLVKGPYNKIVL